MNKKAVGFLAVVLILLAAFYIVRKINKQQAPKIDLPTIAIKNLDGQPIKISDFAGKPFIINFWGTWCGPCRQEFPYFEKALEKYGSRVNFLMISDEPLDKLIKFKEENNYHFEYAQSQKKFNEFGIGSVPVTYFYDAGGKLINAKKDPLTEKELNDFIIELIR